MKIKKCPFYGSDALFVSERNSKSYVRCGKCYAYGPDGKDKEEAIERWNSAPRKKDVEMEQNCGSCVHISGKVDGKVYCCEKIDLNHSCKYWEAKEPEPAHLNSEDSSSLDELCRAAVEKWGATPQIYKAIEELSELITALARYQNADENSDDAILSSADNVREEREDVEIMLRQLDVILVRSEEWRRKKYEHLRAIVK